MAIEYEQIFGWMPLVEGARTCRGYIPCYAVENGRVNKNKRRNYYGTNGTPDMWDPMGVSGVTVGVGVDLGQQSEAKLRKWGVSEVLLDKLRPYIGKADKAAAIALHKASLNLTDAEAMELTYAEQKGYMDEEVVPVWNYKYGSRGRYEDLPWQAQCVIFSLVYQLGWGGLRRRGPCTLKALEAHDWPRAIANLQSGAKGWNGEYHERRFQEGTLLKGAL